jgi:hypothetical protein
VNAQTKLPAPSSADISAHLHALFPPAFVHGYPDALVEIAYGPPGNLNRAELFSAFRLDAATDFAVAKNLEGCNVYVGPTLKKGVTAPFGRTSKEDFLAGGWLWTEYDGPGEIDVARAKAAELGLAPGIIVDTGSTPHARAHVYYKLAGGIADLGEFEGVNRALQNHLGGDPVHDASRVMRLAGTVSYPPAKKLERGYVVEAVKIRLHQKPREHDASAFVKLNPAGSGASHGTRKSGLGFDIPRDDEELSLLLGASRVPGNWHKSMRSAIATMIGRGWSDSAIRLACAAYCDGGARDPDLVPLISGARGKWDKPNPEDGAQGGTRGESKPPRFVFETVSDLRSMPDQEYLVGGWVPENSTGLLYGRWGSGKTFIGFDLALHLSFGLPDWHGAKLPGEPREVLIIAREGHTGFVKRVSAFMQHYELTEDPKNLVFMRSPISFLDDAGFAALKEAIRALKRPFRFVLVDTVGRVLPGADMAKEQPITLFMERLQQVGEITGGTTLGVHHENKSGDANGSMYFQNNSDFMFQTSREGDGPLERGKITCMKQKEGDDLWSREITFAKTTLPNGQTTLVVESVSEGSECSSGRKSTSATPKQKRALAALDEVVLSHGEPVPAHLNLPGTKAASAERWKDELFARGVIDRKAKNPRTDFKRIKDGLADRAMIGERDGLVWRAKE